MRPTSQYLRSMIEDTPQCRLDLGSSTPPFTKNADFFKNVKMSFLPSGLIPETQTLKELLSQHLSSGPKKALASEIALAPGSSQVYTQALATITKPGNTVLIETPTYEPFIACAKLMQLKVRFFKRSFQMNDHNSEERDYAEIKRQARGANVIVLSNPNCPTGHLYSAKFLRKISELTPYLIVDEVFLPLFSKGEMSLLKTSLPSNVLTIGSFSKSLGLSALRLGWLRADKKIISNFEKMGYCFHIDTPTPSVLMGLKALRSWTQLLKPNFNLLQKNRPVIATFNQSHPNVFSHDFSNGHFGVMKIPRGYRNGEEFSKSILKHGLFLRPCRLFYLPKHVRFHALAPQKEFRRAFHIIEKFYD